MQEKMEIRDWQKAVYKNAKNHGFYDEKLTVPELLKLIRDEIDEAQEAWENGDEELFYDEIADIGLITLSVSEEMSIDLQFAMERKHEINKGRPYQHRDKNI